MNETMDFVNITPNTTSPATMAAAAGGEFQGCVPGNVYEESTFPPDVLRLYPSWYPLKDLNTLDVTLKITFYVVAMLVDIVGNGLVILLVTVSKKMRTPTNVLLVNLAVADLFICMLCMWVHLGSSISQDWPFGLAICKANMFAQVTLITSSMLTLTVISMERFFAIVFPLKRGWSLRVITVIIVIIWIVACSIASPQLKVRFLKEKIFKDRHIISCEENWTYVFRSNRCDDYWAPTKLVYHLFVAVVLFFVPIVVMIISYSIICVCLLVRKAPGSQSASQTNSKRRVVRMLVALLVVFVVCWTPIHAIEMRNLFHTSKVSDTVSYVSLFIGYLNSSLNPILYAGFNENFRRGFRDIIIGRGYLPCFAKTTRIRPAIVQVSGCDISTHTPRHNCAVSPTTALDHQQGPMQRRPPANVSNGNSKHLLQVHTVSTSLATTSFNSTA